MKNLVLFILLASFGFSINAQNSNQVKIDAKSNKEVLYGPCTRLGLQTSPLFKEYYNSEYNAYQAKDSIIQKLKSNKKIKKLNYQIVFGSWCGDSQEQLPRFFNIADKLNIPEQKIALYAVDRTKKCGIVQIDDYKVELVPTFFIIYKDKVIGKIIETPKESLEQDILKISEEFFKKK